MNLLRSLFVCLLLVLPAALLFATDESSANSACGFGGQGDAQDSGRDRSDLVVEQKIESESMTGTVVIKIKGDVARYDMPESFGSAFSYLIDLKKKDLTVLMHPQKTTSKMMLEDQKKMTQAQLKEGDIDLTKMALPKATGKKEKVGGWETEIFETIVGKETARFWVVKDFPNYRSINARLAKFETDGGFDPSKFDLGGMVVKCEYNLPPMGAVTMTLLRVHEEKIDDDLFKVPKDYQDNEDEDR
jgi:hypothetical protein